MAKSGLPLNQMALMKIQMSKNNHFPLYLYVKLTADNGMF